MDPAVAVEVAAMSQQRAMEQAIAKGDSEIQRFYCNSTVFITGGSGFMGKQLTEKLLRSCQLSKIYLLLRPKKGKEIHERLDALFQDPLFDTLRKQQPNFEKKIVAIAGDVAELRLGISDQDWGTITNEVDIIHHLAATTRFDEELRLATMINVRGTRETLLLARACQNLKSFVHVSTAYTHALESLAGKIVDEGFHSSPIPPETLITMAETMDVEKFKNLTDRLLQEWPNSYSFTKAVAEEYLRSLSVGLPTAVVRPGVVVAVYREPAPGWLDKTCVFGASGLILGAGLGVIHAIYSDKKTKLGIVPCDYVNNAIIAAGKAAFGSNGGDSTKIYNVTSVARNPFLQGLISTYLSKYVDNVASPSANYFCFGIETSNKLLFMIMTWLMHMIPAYVADFVCLLLGKKRQYVKLCIKLYKMSLALSYFQMHTWLFDDKNLENLQKSLSKTDQIIFNFDITKIDWEEYIQVWGIGVRKYIMKDGLKHTDKAARKQFVLKYLHYGVITPLYLYCLWKIFSNLFYVLGYLTSLIVSQVCKI